MHLHGSGLNVKIRVLVDLVSDEDPLPGSQMAVTVGSREQGWGGGYGGNPVFHKGTNPTVSAPPS